MNYKQTQYKQELIQRLQTTKWQSMVKQFVYLYGNPEDIEARFCESLIPWIELNEKTLQSFYNHSIKRANHA